MLTQVSNVTIIVYPVDDIESVNSSRDFWALLLLGGIQDEILRPAQVEANVSGALQGVATHTSRPVECQAVTIVVPPSDHAVGPSGFCLERDAEIEQPAGFYAPEQVKSMALVGIGSGPLA